MAISQKVKRANKLSFEIENISKKQGAEKDSVQINVLEVDRRRKSAALQGLRNEVVILESRRSDLIQNQLNELAEFAAPVKK